MRYKKILSSQNTIRNHGPRPANAIHKGAKLCEHESGVRNREELR